MDFFNELSVSIKRFKSYEIVRTRVIATYAFMFKNLINLIVGLI